MTLPPLAPGDFPAFFQEMQTWTGKGWEEADAKPYPPFPWQARLVEELAAEARWPDLLDLPTGSGKTVALDIAVFHLALQAEAGSARWAAMRICFVVDRRLVVDEAYTRAQRLEAALLDAAGGETAPPIVRAVAARLQTLAGDGQPPLVARRLRGGAPREDDWARTPCQPTVLCSTVDQVGSRLLFRGYGVSDSMKPLQAGLLGSDALILMDEAHLSQPFRQTVQAIARHASLRGPDTSPVQVALLTATPGDEPKGEWRFQLGREDREREVLARRLRAAKPAKLVTVAKDDDRVAEIVKHTHALLASIEVDEQSGPVVGVIVNRVARARAVHTALVEALGPEAVTLVIGRARAVDREGLAGLLGPIKTGVQPRRTELKVVVATQTLEAGVDLDLDALVTDAASLDALRQRFGRVNRDGRKIEARGVIVAAKSDRKLKPPDPVYGEAVAHTLEALFPLGEETVDFGVDALDARLDEAGLTEAKLAPLLSDKADAPVLMPAYVDLWTHTSPRPAVDPEPALFLHGPNREPASVQLVWRADLDLELGDEALRTLLALAPPRATEAIELPVWTVRSWLADKPADLADVPQAAGALEGGERRVFIWRGVDDERSGIRPSGDIRPGDMVIVPSDLGGCDEYGWNPAQDIWTDDVCEPAAAPYWRKRYFARVTPGLIDQAFIKRAKAKAGLEWSKQARQAALDQAESVKEALATHLASLSDVRGSSYLVAALLALNLPPSMKASLNALKRNGRRPSFSLIKNKDADPVGVVFVADRGLRFSGRHKELNELAERVRHDPRFLFPRALKDVLTSVSTEDDEAASFHGRVQALLRHTHQVVKMVGYFGRCSGLHDDLVYDLCLSGWLHDAGKTDRRFQRVLQGPGFQDETAEALAKSAEGRSPPGAWDRAGLPPHWRHEALSVRLALANTRLQEAYDRALVLWLVGVHHGRGRPFFPHEDRQDEVRRELAAVEGLSPGGLEPGAGPQSLRFVIEGEAFGPTERDSRDLRGLDWMTMFRDLKARYGPWGLARLEAVLRLADHRASEAGQDEAP